MPGLRQDEDTGVLITDHHDVVVLDTAVNETRLTALEGAGGGAANALRVIGPYTYAFDTPGIEDGITFFTPQVGDIITMSVIVIEEEFDGTTPSVGLGTFTAGGYGIHYADPSTPWSEAYGDGMLAGPGLGVEEDIVFVMTQALPLKVYISQGEIGAAAVGGTTGSLSVYLFIASPSVE